MHTTKYLLSSNTTNSLDSPPELLTPLPPQPPHPQSHQTNESDGACSFTDFHLFSLYESTKSCARQSLFTCSEFIKIKAPIRHCCRCWNNTSGPPPVRHYRVTLNSVNWYLFFIYFINWLTGIMYIIKRHCRQCLLLAYSRAQLQTIHSFLHSTLRLSICSIRCLFPSGSMRTVLPSLVCITLNSHIFTALTPSPVIKQAFNDLIPSYHQ